MCVSGIFHLLTSLFLPAYLQVVAIHYMEWLQLVWSRKRGLDWISLLRTSLDELSVCLLMPWTLLCRLISKATMMSPLVSDACLFLIFCVCLIWFDMLALFVCSASALPWVSVWFGEIESNK